jgi:hypothetical protein
MSKRLIYGTCLRCGICGANWPPYDEFNPCPQCQDKTRAMRREPPDHTLEEARLLAKRHEFNRWLEDHHMQELIEAV